LSALNDVFFYTVGGILIQARTECLSFPEKAFLNGPEDFFYFPDNVTCPAVKNESTLYAYIGPQRNESDNAGFQKVFSAERADIFKKDEGYTQFFYLTESKKELLWTLEIDHEFSCFTYLLHLSGPDTYQLIHPYKLALNLFLLQHSFIRRQGLIVHAAGGTVLGKGMVFAAPSGTGKSTLSRLLLQASHNRLFSEERLIIRLSGEQWHVWGTPWHGEGNIACNESAPLSALVFLRQSLETKITRLSPSEGLYRLIQTASIPWYSEEWVNKGLALCESLVQEIPVVELAFRPDLSAVQAVEHFAAEL
jgi:hypothetical protein